MENNMSKGRDEYPTKVTPAYNLMLEWQLEPGSIVMSISTEHQSPGICATQQTGRWKNNRKHLQEHYMLQVWPTRPLLRIIPIQGGRTRNIEGKGKQPGQHHVGNQPHHNRHIKYARRPRSGREQGRERIKLRFRQRRRQQLRAHARRVLSPSLSSHE